MRVLIPSVVLSVCSLTGLYPVTAAAQKPELVVQSGHPFGVYSVAFSPDGRTLASADSHTIIIWDLTSGRQLRSLALPGQSQHLTLTFSPDGRTLGSAENGMIALWDVATGSKLRTLGATLQQNLIAFTRSGDAVAAGVVSGGRSIEVWEVFGGRMLRTLPAPEGASLALSSDGRILAVKGHNKDLFIKLWDVASGGELSTLQLGHYFASFGVAFALSRDGHSLAIDRESTLELWDIDSGTRRTMQNVWFDHFTSFTPDGRILATIGRDGTANFWEVASGNLTGNLVADKAEIYSLAFSTDGRTVAFGDANGRISIWNLEERRRILALGGHTSGVGILRFSPDGRLLVNAPYYTIRVFDMSSGAQLRTWTPRGAQPRRPYDPPPVGCIAVSRDGKTIASGGDAIQLWDVASGAELPDAFGPSGRATRTVTRA